MDDYLSYLLELRVRAQRNPEAVSLIDRCLQILARAEVIDDGAMAALDREVEAIRDELAVRYGAPRTAVLQ